MNNELEQLKTTMKPTVVRISETRKDFNNETHIHEELSSPTECPPNNPKDAIQCENVVSGVIDGKVLEKEIIQVISSNIFCLENVKQEFSVTITDGSVEVSNAQFQCYQDLNLIYSENFIPGSTHPLTCDICHKSFRKKSNLKRHYRSHTGDNPHACVHCGAAFPTRSRLKEHELKHTGLRPHVCDICGKAFSRVSNLTRHLRTHSEEKPYQCDRCESRFIEPTRLREHYLTHVGEKKFSCDVCGKLFLKKFNLKRHVLTHTGDHPFVCWKCGKGFSKKIYLLVHLETHGKDVSSFEADSAIETVASNCVVESDPVCYNEDSSGTNTENQENKIYSCSDCGKNYLKEQNLTNHRKRHQEKGSCIKKSSFECDVCGATFLHMSRLREHMVSHSGEKLYACAICQRSFGRNSNLLRHLQTHTGDKRFACGVCNRRFSSNVRLKEHLSTHTGEMPHVCSECGRNFRHSCGLQRHLLVHSGKKPHKCAACGKRFSRRGRLVTHCKRHHSTGEPKFPNRVEPRLMNIIQNLEARVGSQGENDELSSVDRITRSKGKSNAVCNSDSDDSSEDLDETTLKSITKDKRKTRTSKSKPKTHHSKPNYSSEEFEELTVEVTPASDSELNLCKKQLPKRTTTKTKNTQSELKKRKKSKTKTVIPCSEILPKRTSVECLEKTKSVLSDLELDETSEQIEIEDISAYHTQVISNDLDTIVLVKAAS